MPDTDSAKFRAFADSMKGKCSFFLSEADVPNLIIEVWVGEGRLVIGITNVGRRRLAVQGVVAGLEDPTLMELHGSGNESQFFDNWIGIGWNLELRHLNGEFMILGKIKQVRLKQDAATWQRLVKNARSPKRWRDASHARHGVCEEVLHSLPPVLARQTLRLFPQLTLNGRIAIASLLIKAYDLGLFGEAMKLALGALVSDWAYQAPEVRGDPAWAGNRSVYDRLWATIEHMHQQESSRGNP